MNFTGDIRTARVSFYTRNGTTLTPINGAQNLPVGLVNPGDLSTGTASAIVQYNIGSAVATTLNIAVRVTGNYVENPSPNNDALVTIAVPTPGGLITGGGLLCNTNSAGYVKGSASNMTDISFYVQYNKSLTNPQGRVEMTIRSYNDRNGNTTTVLHTYKVKTTAISTLAVNSPTAQFSSKANISELVNGVEVSMEGGCTLQFDMYDGQAFGATTTADQVGITLYRKAGGVWYSNNWNGTKTVLENTCGATVSVTGNGGNTTTIAPSQIQKQTESETISEQKTFNMKAFPNPTTNQFNVQVESDNTKEKINLRVFDLSGRTVELLWNITSGQTLQIGSKYRPGMYIVEMIQGNNRKQLKLLKQPD